MKKKIFIPVLFLLLIFSINVFTQPYTLDDKLKPTELKLRDLKDVKDAKGLFASQVLKKGQVEYFYVTNFDIYQFIDLYVFSLNNKEDLLVEISKNTWKDIEDSQQLKNATDNFINFSIRTYNDFGIKVTNVSSEVIHYGLAIYATPPVKGYLKSPFVKATKYNVGDSANTSLETQDDNLESSVKKSGVPSYIYMIIGSLITLVLILLYKKKSANSKNVGCILILISISVSSVSLNAQSTSRPTNAQLGALDFLIKKDKVYRDKFIKDLIDNNNPNLSGLNDVREALGKMDKIASDIRGKVDKATATYDAVKNYYNSYKNLGSCINSTSPPGQPRIPSFCTDENNDCADCFVSARSEFNRLRYQLEKLQTIYNCTKSYTEAAIAFGDNVSSYHGVTGLVWQSERIDILKEMAKLNKSYDKKRVELLEKFNNSLVELAACEEEHGIPDWYDRFGVLFYNFMEMRYHR